MSQPESLPDQLAREWRVVWPGGEVSVCRDEDGARSLANHRDVPSTQKIGVVQCRGVTDWRTPDEERD